MDARTPLDRLAGVIIAWPIALLASGALIGLLFAPLMSVFDAWFGTDGPFWVSTISIFVVSLGLAFGIDTFAARRMKLLSQNARRAQRIVLGVMNVLFIALALLVFVTIMTSTIKKPVIYLYPTEPTNVSVNVVPRGVITASEPLLGSGWHVLAQPDGTLSSDTPYLFYEATTLRPRTIGGWRIDRSSFVSWARVTLPALGLNERETADFIDYWSDHLPNADRVDVLLIDPVWLDRNARLDIEPSPETIIRRDFVFAPASGSAPSTPNVPMPDRNGFVVVEWGGTVR